MKKKILVIDDEDDIRRVVQVSLECVAGWDVITASSGLEGVYRAKIDHPDAILLDILMPGMDGYAALHNLRQESSTKDIPVFLLTAKLKESDLGRFTKMGVKAILSKPFNPVQMPRQIAQTMGWNTGL